MRFKTGEKVEVMSNKEVPVSWRSAEILFRSGDAYTIQYDCYPGMASKQLVEMVSRKFVRPCPSLLQDMKNFISGDIVEVFHQHSWKIAVVLNVLGGKKESKKNKIHCKVSTFKNQYLVRLLGCSEELAVDRSNIRMRQTWHDGKWVPMGKVLFVSLFLRLLESFPPQIYMNTFNWHLQNILCIRSSIICMMSSNLPLWNSSCLILLVFLSEKCFQSDLHVHCIR